MGARFVWILYAASPVGEDGCIDEDGTPGPFGLDVINEESGVSEVLDAVLTTPVKSAAAGTSPKRSVSSAAPAEESAVTTAVATTA